MFESGSESGVLIKAYSTTFHRPFTCLAMFWEWHTNDHTFSHYEIRLDIQGFIVFYSHSLGPYIRVAKSKLITTACQLDCAEEWTWSSCVSLPNAVVKMQIQSEATYIKITDVTMKFSANCPFFMTNGLSICILQNNLSQKVQLFHTTYAEVATSTLKRGFNSFAR